MTDMTTLENGLHVLRVPVEGTEATTILVLVRVGSRYESPEVGGASHFIEHLMFKGTRKRPRGIDISRTLDAVGAEYNAFTGKDHTGYYIKVNSAHADLAVEVLHDVLTDSLFAPEEMEKERGVIIEEINMYEDNPLMHVENLIEANVFSGHALGRDIAGTRETMRAMTREQVLDYRNAHYLPSRMMVAVAGKVPEQIMSLLQQTFGRIPAATSIPAPFAPFSPSASPASAIVQYKDTQQVQLVLGFRGFSMTDPRLPQAQLLSVILGGSMSSRLFVSIREDKGLAYMVRMEHAAYEDTGAFYLQSGLDQSRLPLAMETIRQELDDIASKGPEAQEIQRAIDYIYGRTLLNLEDSSERAQWYAKQWMFLPRVEDPEVWIRRFDGVTPEDLSRLAREVLAKGNAYSAVIGPYQDSQAFLTVAHPFL